MKIDSVALFKICVVVVCIGMVGFVFNRFTSDTVRPNLTTSFLPRSFLNNQILSVIKNEIAMNTPDSRRVSWASSTFGVTQDIYYQGRKVASAGPLEGSYCSGITFQAFMMACEREAGKNYLLKGLSGANIEKFRKDWYGTDGNRKTLVNALISRDLGMEIVDPDAAAPGDFVQFWWRDGYGHSVVFLNWVRNKRGHIIGLRHWSANRGAIGIAEDMVGKVGRRIDSAQIYIVRAYAP